MQDQDKPMNSGTQPEGKYQTAEPNGASDGGKRSPSRFNLTDFFKKKQFRYGSYALLATALVVVALVLINVAVKAIEDNWALRLDLSYNSITKFSDTTKSALKDLTKDVKFYHLAASGQENAQLAEVLDRYRASSGHVEVIAIDPDKNPGLVNKFRGSSSSLGSNTVVVTNADETRFKVITYYDMVNIATDSSTGEYYISSYQFERVLTQGMLYVTADKTQAAYFLQGHGEASLSDLSALVTLLNDNNYDVNEIPLGGDMPDPDGSFVVVAAPQRDLDERDRIKLLEYAQAGGGFLFAWDILSPIDLPNFNTILQYYNVGYESGVVVANSSDASQYYYSPSYLLSRLGEHDVTTPLTENGRSYVLSMDSLAIKMPEMSKNEIEITPLLSSDTGSFLADPNVQRTDWTRMPEEPLGPFNTAVAALRHNFTDDSKSSRAIVMGSVSSIASSTLLNQFSNGEFVMSAVKWASKDAAVNISVLSKQASRGSLQITSQAEMYLLAGLSILLLPVLILAAGITVTLRRRHL
ncbi:MAG: Gldg family protein [Oscillospiraceae bacterium]|jgi:hypothetical protein|nr:Gldg family protein [Oscillospiraceae bacterium]